MLASEELPTVTLYHTETGDGWHDGAGWYYVIDEYEDEGSCGAFDTYEEATSHARAAGYAIGGVL